jgi:hypothetical protein
MAWALQWLRGYQTTLPRSGGDGSTPVSLPPPANSGIGIPCDVWLLGPHRVGCGGCTDSKLASAVLGTSLPRLMVTDPPYGVEYDPAWRHKRGRGQNPVYRSVLQNSALLHSVNGLVSQAIETQFDNQSRPGSACHILRCLRHVGRGDGANPKVWDDGEVT